MYAEQLYHGTNKERGLRILHERRMEPSRGDRHWLGDGSYFFEELFYSFKWIVDMFAERYQDLKCDLQELSDRYMIISIFLQLDRNRLFDLTKLEHKIIYDRMVKRMEEKKLLTDKYRESEFVEGVVINYMFNELEEYPRDFDAIRGMFLINKSNYREFKTRLGYMPQVQICVRNVEVIRSLEEYDFIKEYSDLQQKLTEFSRLGSEQQINQRSVYSLKRGKGPPWRRR